MQHHRRHQPHFPDGGAATPSGGPAGSAAVTPSSTSSEFKRGKKRGSYNCGRCGLPKKGHSCNISSSAATTPTTDASADISAHYSLSSTTRPPPPRQPYSHLRRALSFDDVDNGSGFDAPEEEDEDDLGAAMEDIEADPVSGGLPASCVWEVLRRLPPSGLLSAAKVCKGWRETARRLWKAAEVLRLRVPPMAQVGLVGSMLHKCPALVSLSLRMERY